MVHNHFQAMDDSSGGPGRRSPLWRALRLVAAILILILAVLFLKNLLQEIGPDRVLKALLDADPPLLLLTFLAVAARWWFWSRKWRAIALREQLDVHRRAFLPGLLCGSFTDLVAPTAKTAGGFLRTWLVAARSRLPAVTVYGTTLQDQVTNTLGVFLVSFVAMAAIPFWHSPAVADASALTRTNRLTICGLGLAGILLLVALLIFRRSLGRFLSRRDYRGLLIAVHRPLRLIPPFRARYPDGDSFAEAVAGKSREIFGPLSRLLESKRGTVKDVSLGAFLWLCYCTGNYFAFRACGAGPDEAPFLMVAAILSLGNMLGILSTVPGGIGVTEASLIGLHILFGVRPELAAAASLLFRLAYYLFILVTGGTSFIWASRIRKRMARRDAAARESALQEVQP